VIEGFLVGLAGLRHLSRAGYVYIWGSGLWAVLSVFVITAPAAWLGLSHLGFVAHREASYSPMIVWETFRKTFRKTIWFALFGAIFVLINVSNLFVYRNAVGTEALLLRIVWGGALVIWFGLQLYAFPLYHAMTVPSLRGAYRNTLVMIIRNPLFTLGVWIVAGLVIGFSVLFPIAFVLITGGALSAIGNEAVQNRLRAAGIEKDPLPQHLSEDSSYWDGVS
jgi:uncharacterized membrane protein YesL